MSKELIIEARIALPDDYFEEAEVVAKLKTARDDFRIALSEATGQEQTVSVTTRTKRQPSSKPRKARTPRAAANGAVTQPAA